jgi:Ion channel
MPAVRSVDASGIRGVPYDAPMAHAPSSVEVTVQRLRRNPSAALLAAQLLTILAYPFLVTSTAGRATLGVAGVVVVVAALWAVRSTPALTWVALLLGLPATVLAVLEAIDPSNETVVLVSALFHAPFYFYVSYAMIRYVFADDRITSDEIYATGAAFTVVAWGFAYVYAAAQVLWPGSFSGIGGPGDRSWYELLFLSFTTLTSTGLSDITPALEHTRSLSMVEQVTGVFYIAFVVSRLVALSVRSRHSEDSA